MKWRDIKIISNINYPDIFELGNIKFHRHENEFLLVFDKRLKREEIRAFLDRQKELINYRFEPKDRKKLNLIRFNRSNFHRKWIILNYKKKEELDEILKMITTDKRISLVRPIYYRKDLNYHNGFAFSDKIIVILTKKSSPKEVEKIALEKGLTIVKGNNGQLGKQRLLLQLTDLNKHNLIELTKQLSENENIKSAKINMIQLHFAFLQIPNDTFFTNQWNLQNTGQTVSDGGTGTVGADINVVPAWDITKGSPLVTIAILDTGCDLIHGDLTPNYVQKEKFYNVATGSNDPEDDKGHGTCCAGIAAASTNSINPNGVAGVSWYCRILPIRMILSNGSELEEAYILSSLEKVREHKAKVVSMSWHWDGDQTDVSVSFQECVDNGIVLVAASGNSAGSQPDIIAYPASDPNVIAVGATNENDERCNGLDWSSNYGSQYGPELSVVAPGVHVWAPDMLGTAGGFNSMKGGGDTAGNYFEDFSGTSAATPHVAGLAGLMLSLNPSLTPAQIQQIIESNADDQVGDPAEDTPGWDKYMGHGRINAYAALDYVRNNNPFTPADVYIRDSLIDTGQEPYLGHPLCLSPDIIIRKNQVANPQVDFADMSIDFGSDNVEIGNDNYLYIRVHNKGTKDTPIHVKVYFAPLTGACTPDLWQFIGQIDFNNVSAGQSAVSNELIWEKVPDPGDVGHFCIIASIEGYLDPHPNPSGISNPTEYMDFIRNNNNICYRNVVFEDVLPNTLSVFSFILPGIVHDQNKFDFRLIGNQLFQDAEVILGINNDILKEPRDFLVNAIELKDKKINDLRFFKMDNKEFSIIKGLLPPLKSKNIAILKIRIPKDVKPKDTIELRTEFLYDNNVLGEINFKLNVLDEKDVKFIGDSSKYLIHKTNCKTLSKIDRIQYKPFKSLSDAIGNGFDLANDCIIQPFTSKEISYRLKRKILYMVNITELPTDILKLMQKNLSREYYTRKYGKNSAREKVNADNATKLIMTKNIKGHFHSVKEIENLLDDAKDFFMDLVNSLKNY